MGILRLSTIGFGVTKCNVWNFSIFGFQNQWWKPCKDRMYSFREIWSEVSSHFKCLHCMPLPCYRQVSRGNVNALLCTKYNTSHVGTECRHFSYAQAMPTWSCLATCHPLVGLLGSKEHWFLNHLNFHTKGGLRFQRARISQFHQPHGWLLQRWSNAPIWFWWIFEFLHFLICTNNTNVFIGSNG